MPHLSSTASDSLSQFQQFNWSLNIFPETDAAPATKTVGSSALQSSSTDSNEPLALSPIGSQCYSNQSSLSTNSSNDSPPSVQVGGSAQLRQSPAATNREHRAGSGDGSEFDKHKHPSKTLITSPTTITPESTKQHLFRSSPPTFCKQHISPNSDVNSSSNISPSSTDPPPNVPSKVARSTPFVNQSVITRSTSQEHQNAPLPRSSTTLWMGDLESWMDEDYVRRCLVMMGWHLPHFASTSASGLKTDVRPNGVNVKIKMISGASPSSAYCFLTYPNAEMAEHAWKMISNMPPTLMPGCERTFKLNWATGLPGVQPTWDREFSVFIRDLDREVTEGELVALFTRSFPSTKSAKIMGDLSTGLSRGYAFIRFGEESDMHRALALGRSKSGTGLFLRGRCIKITEASGSSGTAGDHAHHRASISAAHHSASQKPRSELSSNNTFAGHRDDHVDAGFKSSSIPNVRVITNSLTNENPNLSLRSTSDRMSLSQATSGLPTSSNVRLSSSYPPLTSGVTPSRVVPNGLSNDSTNPNLRLNRDSVTQRVGRLSSSMSALRLSPGYAQLGTNANVSQTSSIPVNAPNFGRTFSACSPLMGRARSIPNPVFQNHYGAPLSHSVCGFPPQGLLPSPQAVYTPYDLGPQTGSVLSSCSMPMATTVAPQSSQLLSHTQTQAMFPNINPSNANQNSFPSTYMTSGGMLSAAGGPISASVTHQYGATMQTTYDAGLPARTLATPPSSMNPHLAALSQIASVANDASNDPSNTTVFVGGLPACISEGTLKTFFQNFGEITYVKIPPNKGCGFVQYVRREDAKQAMLKMHDFPIHGKSRIRLSWGRSLGDKQVEYVKKLSSALGISFESVWKIVQGQDPSMIKQIASTLGAGGGAQPSLTASARSDMPTRRDSDHPRPVQPLSSLAPTVPNHSGYNIGFVSNGSSATTNLSSSSVILHNGYLSAEPLAIQTSLEGNCFPGNNYANERQDLLSRPSVAKPQLQRSLTTNSQGLQPIPQGRVSSPIPSVGPRNSWQGLLSNDKPALPSQRAISTIGCSDFSLPNRRATIHPITPTSFPSENIPTLQLYQLQSPASTAPLVSREGSSDSLEYKWTSLGLKNMTKGACSPIKERHEYRLNHMSFLEELSRGEVRETNNFEFNPPPRYDSRSNETFESHVDLTPSNINLGTQSSATQATARESLESCWSFPL